jgi:YaiO family outer membrane protein
MIFKSLKYTVIKRVLLGVVLFCNALNISAQTKSNLSADEYYRLAKIEANQKNNYALGAKYCLKGLEQTPENYDIRQLLGKCYLELGKYDSARYHLKKVTDGYPRNVDARHYLINVEYNTGRFSSALCYVNELLEIRPYSKTLWLKKVSIYNDMGNYPEAKRTVNRLYTIFPNDTTVRNVYNNFFKEEAERSHKQGDYRKSREILDKLLEDNPRDLLTIHKQVNNLLNTGKRDDAMGLVDAGLVNFPADPILIDKKVGLLQEAGRYQEALAFTEATLKKYPNAKLRALNTELKLEAARFYNNSDPYVLYQKVYESNPGNEEAFNYLLNNAISKGYFDEAYGYLSSALKRNPNDKNLQYKLLSLYDGQGKTAEANKLVEKLAAKFPSDEELQIRYSAILLQQAKGYFQDQLYTQAKPLFEKLTRYSDYSTTANEYLYSIEVAQRNFPQALTLIDRLIARSPRNEDYQFKKSGLLEEMGRYDEAMNITASLAQRNPTNAKYRDAFSSQSTPLIKQLLENEKYDSALYVINQVLERDPSNLQAHNYAINVAAAKKDYKTGVEYCDRALVYYPESKEIKLKKAGMLTSGKEYDKSIPLLGELTTQFPYNDKIKGSLAEEYYTTARSFERKGDIDSAIRYYNSALNMVPSDTFSMFKLINLKLGRKEYADANALLDSGLSIYPDNYTLLYRKGVLNEEVQDFDSAYYFIKQAEPQYGNNWNYQNYLDYLKGKTYKNQAGVMFLRAFFDSTQLRSSIASFEYTRFQPRNTYIFRLNYAARPIGNGLQQEIEWFHKLNKKLYTQATIAYANQFVFPKFRISGSVFNNLVYDWETELGLRYVLQRDNASLTSLVAGVAKSWEDVWVNFRGFVMTDFSRVYQTLLFQSRYYFNYKNDYLFATASIGTPPDDKALDFQINSFVNFVTRMVGAGYQHKIRHRTSILLQGNWYNFKIKEDYYVNQYNVFISLLTKL